MAVAYFREAFALSLGDAKEIGASSIFLDGPRTDAKLDKEVAPMIEATRHLWNVR
jgi:hypothetical protein